MSAHLYSLFRKGSQELFDTERLLARYPRLDEQELSRLLEIFPALSLIDRAVISADTQLSEKLADFHRDHRRELEAPNSFLLLLLLLLIVAASSVVGWVFGR